VNRSRIVIHSNESLWTKESLTDHFIHTRSTERTTGKVLLGARIRRFTSPKNSLHPQPFFFLYFESKISGMDLGRDRLEKTEEPGIAPRKVP
jgi:hypothetical protein